MPRIVAEDHRLPGVRLTTGAAQAVQRGCANHRSVGGKANAARGEEDRPGR